MGKNMTTAEMLAAWDAGEPVWTIEMGGMGPGYEQAIQVTVFEVLRGLVAADGFGIESGADLTDEQRKQVDDLVRAADKKFDIGLSGAQEGAAKSLAYGFYLRGQAKVLSEVEDDRHILASNRWVGAVIAPPKARAPDAALTRAGGA